MPTTFDRNELGVDDLRQRIAHLEAENRALSERQIGVEQQLSDLAAQLVAIATLHSSLSAPGTIAAITEITANLIGCEMLAIFDVDTAQNRLSLIGSLGVDAARYDGRTVGDDAIGRCVKTGQPQFGPDGATTADAATPAACVPLLLGDRVTGVLVAFQLLPHKPGFEPIDFEIVSLLSTHAARALALARWFGESAGARG